MAASLRSSALDVVVVNDFAAVTGGADRVALAEAEGLARRGHTVTLLAGQGTPPRELVDAGVRVRTTGQPATRDHPNRVRASAQGIWNRAAADLLKGVLAESDPGRTVVHFHGFTKVLSASVIRAAVESPATTLATLHDYFAVCPNGGYFNYQTDEVCRLTPLSASCVASHCDARAYTHKLWRVVRSSVQRSAGAMPRGIDHLIVPSRAAAGIMRPFLPRTARLHVLSNPVPVTRTEPVDVAGNSEFVFIGRLSHEKGPAILARAARLAGVPAVFVGAGEEEEAIRAEYPQAEVTGWVAPSQVVGHLRRSRAMVNASICYEIQPLSALEAAAHGIPAVVPKLGALKDMVADGHTGLWFERGDSDDLSAKLRRLAGDDQLVRNLGRAGYERFWSERWDLETHLDQIEELCRARAPSV